jgi:hypothetical protein
MRTVQIRKHAVGRVLKRIQPRQKLYRTLGGNEQCKIKIDKAKAAAANKVATAANKVAAATNKVAAVANKVVAVVNKVVAADKAAVNKVVAADKVAAVANKVAVNKVVVADKVAAVANKVAAKAAPKPFDGSCSIDCECLFFSLARHRF